MPSDKTSWYLLNSGSDTAAHNMALDAALLEASGELPGPVLRFYSWTDPAASFGYFQKFAEIEKMTLLRPLVRRPTGGGLVPHDTDWTYSLTVPPECEWYGLSATESYRRMHEWIRAAFAKIGVTAELAAACRKASPGQCFAGHEKFDVLWQGRKIAGAAQRRTRAGLLIQGSVQPPPKIALARPPGTLSPSKGRVEGLSRDQWEQAMVEAASAFVGREQRDFTLPPALARRRNELAAGTYSQPSHNCRR